MRGLTEISKNFLCYAAHQLKIACQKFNVQRKNNKMEISEPSFVGKVLGNLDVK